MTQQQIDDILARYPLIEPADFKYQTARDDVVVLTDAFMVAAKVIARLRGRLRECDACKQAIPELLDTLDAVTQERDRLLWRDK